MTTDPTRTPLQRVLMTAFKTGLVVFLLAGTLLVLLQVVGIVVSEEGLVTGTIPGLQQTMTWAAGITGLLGFAMAYVFGWSGGED